MEKNFFVKGQFKTYNVKVIAFINYRSEMVSVYDINTDTYSLVMRKHSKIEVYVDGKMWIKSKDFYDESDFFTYVKRKERKIKAMIKKIKAKEIDKTLTEELNEEGYS